MVNRALKSADCSANSIGNEGTAALSDALKSNSTLEELKLWQNEIGAAGKYSKSNASKQHKRNNNTGNDNKSMSKK